jgi:hypothetical protein
VLGEGTVTLWNVMGTASWRETFGVVMAACEAVSLGGYVGFLFSSSQSGNTENEGITIHRNVGTTSSKRRC